MRARLATFVLAAAAAAAGAGATAQPAQSHPVQIAPGEELARLRAENQRLRADLDAALDGLEQIDRANHRNRDRGARRVIDRLVDDLRARLGDRDGDGDRDRDRDRDYDRDHRDQPQPQPQARLLSDPDWRALYAQVAGASFESNRIDTVRTAAQANVFTVDQVVALMQTSSFDDTRVEIAVTLRPRVVDPQRWYLVEGALSFDGSRDSLRQRLGQ
jgi:ribosomal protein L17